MRFCVPGMPVQAGVQIAEQPGQQHVDLADERFLGGGAVDADRPLELVLVVNLLDGQGGTDRGGPQGAVAAAMAGGSALGGLANAADLLRQFRQGVVLGQNADDRRPGAVFGHERGRHPGDAFGDLEAGLFEDSVRRAAERCSSSPSSAKAQMS